MKKIQAKTNKFMYNGLMVYFVAIMVILSNPLDAFARIPTPNQIALQQNAVHGAYTPHAGSWGSHNVDPYLAGQGFSGAQGQYAQYPRNINTMQTAISTFDIFTSKGSFGQKLKLLIMDTADKRLIKPMEQRLYQATSMEQLYALASRTVSPQQNQAYQNCVGCIQNHPNAWQPTHSNPHAVNPNAFTTFGTQPNASGGGLGGVVTPLGQ